MKRAEAKALGLKHYMPDAACPAGHIARRFVSNGGCDECLKAANRRYQADNRDALLPKKLAWAKANPEKNSAQSNEWQRKNKAKAFATQAAAKSKRPHHYRSIGRSAAAKRRASMLARTPSWADLDAIAAIYKACPHGMEVDHIVPLQGRLVSGLHVENNLQYLNKSQNSSKGARWE